MISWISVSVISASSHKRMIEVLLLERVAVILRVFFWVKPSLIWSVGSKRLDFIPKLN